MNNRKHGKSRVLIGLQIEKSDLALIDKAREVSHHNRSAFLRHAAIKKARDILRRSK